MKPVEQTSECDIFFFQRKETLLVEHLKRNKVNKFVDHRIGEADLEMSVEDKMLKRFAVERQVCVLICV